MKINTTELRFRAKQITQNHQHNISRVKRSQWLQSAFNSIAFGNLNIFSRLIDTHNEDIDLKQLDINQQFETKFRETILHSLCRNERILMMEHFLINGLGDPNEYSTEGGVTSFHLAVMKAIFSEDIQTVDLLLNHRADILKLTKKGQNVEQLVRRIDYNLEKDCSKYIMGKYLEALSLEKQVILMQVLDSAAIDEPPFNFMTSQEIIDLLYLL